LCIADKDCDDLEKGKVYLIVPDDSAAKEGYVRVKSYFVSVELPQEAQDALSENSGQIQYPTD
jgi:hypothetical protein